MKGEIYGRGGGIPPTSRASTTNAGSAGGSPRPSGRGPSLSERGPRSSSTSEASRDRPHPSQGALRVREEAVVDNLGVALLIGTGLWVLLLFVIEARAVATGKPTISARVRSLGRGAANLLGILVFVLGRS